MDRTQQLEDALREELQQLWNDLFWAIRSAHNDEWSVQCDNLASRIQALTKLVGPTPPEQISYGLLREGQEVYERLHTEIGADIDREELARCRSAAEDYFARTQEQLNA